MTDLDPLDPKVFRNPIITGFNPDPTICVVPAEGDTPTTYFLSTSTFEYFPGCAVYTSTNLLEWTLIGHALTRRSQIELRTVEPGAGSWASTLRYRAGERRWYLATCLFQRYRPASDERVFPRGFYVWTDNIWDQSAWSDPVHFDNPGFDQDLFWDDDDDGKVYLSTTTRLAQRAPHSTHKDFAIHISEIDLATGRSLTAPAVIRASPHGIAEGSHIVKRGGWYYLFTAEGGTEAGHQEWVFRSKRGVFGPWEGQGTPLWYNGPGEEVQRTGHADVFEDGEGRWWAVLLGVRPAAKDGRWLEPQLGRETFLVKVDWVDEWPVFNEGKNITLLTQGRDAQLRAPGKYSNEPSTWTADLTKPDLELGWYQKNTPLKPTHSLTERPGHLRLHGTCHDLASPEAPAMLLRKQTRYRQTFRATMAFGPSKCGYEAGVVLWWSPFAHAALGVARVEGGPGGAGARATVVRRSPGGRAGVVLASYPLLASEGLPEEVVGGMFDAQQPVELTLRCSGVVYDLEIRQGTFLSALSCRAEDLTVMPPVGGAFTGVMFGVYSFGKGEPVLDAADFTDISVTHQGPS